MLDHTRIGSGPPLVLVHGIGSHRQAWDPIVGLLAPHREVITLDLPGCGRTPLSRDQNCTPVGLAETVAEFFAEIGLERPHVVGNSLGGWIALELARRGEVASVTALSPAGLWRTCPWISRVQIRGMHDLPTTLGPLVRVIARIPPLRVAMTANVWGRPWKLSREEMLAEVAGVVNSESFYPILEASQHFRFAGGMSIDVPLTIAFGKRDVLLGVGCRVREELPAHVRWLEPHGWGHLPTWDDPQGVADLILEGSAAEVSGLSATG